MKHTATTLVLLFLLGGAALAQTAAPPVNPEPTPAPVPAEGLASLVGDDFKTLQEAVATSDDHRSVAWDGSTHAMVDGTDLLHKFMALRTKVQKLANIDAQQKADSAGAEAAKRSEALTELAKEAQSPHPPHPSLPLLQQQNYTPIPRGSAN